MLQLSKDTHTRRLLREVETQISRGGLHALAARETSGELRGYDGRAEISARYRESLRGYIRAVERASTETGRALGVCAVWAGWERGRRGVCVRACVGWARMMLAGDVYVCFGKGVCAGWWSGRVEGLVGVYDALYGDMTVREKVLVRGAIVLSVARRVREGEAGGRDTAECYMAAVATEGETHVDAYVARAARGAPKVERLERRLKRLVDGMLYPDGAPRSNAFLQRSLPALALALAAAETRHAGLLASPRVRRLVVYTYMRFPSGTCTCAGAVQAGLWRYVYPRSRVAAGVCSEGDVCGRGVYLRARVALRLAPRGGRCAEGGCVRGVVYFRSRGLVMGRGKGRLFVYDARGRSVEVVYHSVCFILRTSFSAVEQTTRMFPVASRTSAAFVSHVYTHAGVTSLTSLPRKRAVSTTRTLDTMHMFNNTLIYTHVTFHKTLHTHTHTLHIPLHISISHTCDGHGRCDVLLAHRRKVVSVAILADMGIHAKVRRDRRGQVFVVEGVARKGCVWVVVGGRVWKRARGVVVVESAAGKRVFRMRRDGSVFVAR